LTYSEVVAAAQCSSFDLNSEDSEDSRSSPVDLYSEVIAGTQYSSIDLDSVDSEDF